MEESDITKTVAYDRYKDLIEEWDTLTDGERKRKRADNLIELGEALRKFSHYWSIALTSNPMESNKASAIVIKNWVDGQDPVCASVIIAICLMQTIDEAMAELSEEIK